MPGLGMRIHQIRQLLPVTTVERAHLDRRHQQASTALETVRDDKARYRCGTSSLDRSR